LPKRGFSNGRFQKEWIILNVEQLNQFSQGTEINIERLVAADLIGQKQTKKGDVYIKLLGDGELKISNLKVKVHKISQIAKEKIEKMQGVVELIPPRAKRKKWAKKRTSGRTNA
jgi:large subunit ribosomal protein L15